MAGSAACTLEFDSCHKDTRHQHAGAQLGTGTRVIIFVHTAELEGNGLMRGVVVEAVSSSESIQSPDKNRMTAFTVVGKLRDGVVLHL